MSDEARKLVVSEINATWTRVPGRTSDDACVALKFKRSPDCQTDALIEEIRLSPPRKWKPGAVYVGTTSSRLSELKAGATTLSDSHGRAWEVSQQMTRDAWTVVLCNPQPEQELPITWEFDVVITFDKPSDSSSAEMSIDVDDQKMTASFALSEKHCAAAALVKLESDPSRTNALQRGQEVILHWEVQNIEGDAELRGSLLGANTMRIANGSKGQCSVRALGESVYTLSAVIIQDGKRLELVREVRINLATPQFGLNLDHFPSLVFPNGPIVAYRSAIEVGKVQFMCTGGGPTPPDLNARGKLATIEDTFVIDYGPREGHTWTFGAIYSSPQGERSTPNRSVTSIEPVKVENSMFLHLPITFGLDQALPACAMAAGSFFVTSNDVIPRVAKRDWIAIATTNGMELWVRDPSNRAVKAAADVQGAQWSNNWLADALSGPFWGVGSANNLNQPESQSVIAIRTSDDQPSIVEVIEFDLPLRENSPHRTVLSFADPRFFRSNVRILAVGNRIFLLGNGVAISYERNLRLTTFQDEPQLAMIASPEWDAVALAPECAITANGHIFAIEKKTGMFLRFDVKNGTVQSPRMAAHGNARVAPLDKLQQMQASSLVLQPFPREACIEGRGYVGTNPDGSISNYLNPINEHSVMVALGGALLVRSEVVDPSIGGQIQDRAYDPRLDVWARCGHPFGLANCSTTSLFASTSDALYCLVDDQLHYVEGSLPAFAGFLAADYSPLDTKYLADPPWPSTFVFPIVDNRTALPLKWVDGRMSPEVLNQGRLRLALENEDSVLITIEANVDRNTGELSQPRAMVHTTGREIKLCKITGNVLTLEPMQTTLQFVATGTLVLPFSYRISGVGLPTIIGESQTGQTIAIPSVTGETFCQVEFKYTRENSALDARARIIIVQGAIADLQLTGQHAHLFHIEIVDGAIVQLGLVD